jgi:hypothetical protein
MKQKGKVSISRTTSGTHLMVVTDVIGDDIAEVEMSEDQFSSLITCQQAKCEITVPSDQ